MPPSLPRLTDRATAEPRTATRAVLALEAFAQSAPARLPRHLPWTLLLALVREAERRKLRAKSTGKLLASFAEGDALATASAQGETP